MHPLTRFYLLEKIVLKQKLSMPQIFSSCMKMIMSDMCVLYAVCVAVWRAHNNVHIRLGKMICQNPLINCPEISSLKIARASSRIISPPFLVKTIKTEICRNAIGSAKIAATKSAYTLWMRAISTMVNSIWHRTMDLRVCAWVYMYAKCGIGNMRQYNLIMAQRIRSQCSKWFIANTDELRWCRD